MTTYPPIVIDTREQTPLQFPDWPTVREKLEVGDYGLRGFSDWTRPYFVIERKSLPDLIHSLTGDRERFLREVEKLRQFRQAAIVIEGLREEVEAHKYRSQVKPDCIINSLLAIQWRTGVHVFWCGDAEGAAKMVVGSARVFLHGIEKDFNAIEKNAIKEETGTMEQKS